MVVTILLVALLVAPRASAQQCAYQTSCMLAAECRNALSSSGLPVELSQLPRCGFKGNFPKLCCPQLQLGMAPFRDTSTTSTTTPRPSSTTPRPTSTTPRYYSTYSTTPKSYGTSSTARPYRPPADRQQTAAASYTTQRVPEARPLTLAPSRKPIASSTPKPLPSISKPTIQTHVRGPAANQGSAGVHVGSKGPQPLVLGNKTEVRITPIREPPASATKVNNSASASYPGANLVNSAHGGPITFQQEAVLAEVIDNVKKPTNKDLMQHPNLRLLPVDRCGRNAAESTERIRGYQRASIGEYPWVAQLGEIRGDDFRHICSGSVINKRYILTAALCIRPEVTWVRLGEYNTLTEPDCLNSDDCAESVLDIEIHEKIRHPRYDKPYAQNDIGLVRLRRSLPRLFTSYIRPVCIPLKPEIKLEESRTRLITVGWGVTNSVTKIYSDILQAAELPLISNKECGNLQESALLRNVANTQLCTNSSNYISTACQGDTGGPLMLLTHGYRAQSETPVYMQVGIVSHGPYECSAQGVPTIFTRVSAYAEWILDTIRE